MRRSSSGTSVRWATASSRWPACRAIRTSYYAGAASGGIFKTTDNGAHWEPIFDDQPVSSIGSLAVAAVRSERRLGRHRRGVHPQQHLDRQRHLQVDRRRQDLDAHGPRQDRPHRPHRHRPEEPRHRARVRARPRLRSAAGARRLPHHRRRQDVGARRCSSTRTPAAPTSRWTRTTRACCSPACGRSRSTRGGATSGGPGSGLFKSIDGGVDVEAARRRTACRQRAASARCRRRSRRSNSEPRLRADRNRRRHADCNGQPTQSGSLWRSDDGGEHWEMVSSDRRLRGRTHYYTRFAVDRRQRERSVVSRRRVHARRSTAARRASISTGGRRAERRQPRHVDRSDQRRTHGRRARRWLELLGQSRQELASDPAAGRADVSRRHRQSDSVQRLRQPAGRSVDARTEQQPPRQAVGRGRDAGPIPRGMWHSVAGGESGWAIPDPVDDNIVWATRHRLREPRRHRRALRRAHASGARGGDLARSHGRRRRRRA